MTRLPSRRLPALVLAVAAAAGAAQADAPALLSDSQTAARGLFDLCREDAPDAARVAEHGEVWGWPRFMGYLEHPDGYRRLAGGESRRAFQDGDQRAFVEATVQSGIVDSAAPVDVRYFRCNAASDQPVNGDLEAYFTAHYGAPSTKTDAITVWLDGAAKGADPGDDAAALKAVAAASPGAEGTRIELTREHGLDRAKLTLFLNGPPADP
ncbi:MAG TPA: hypothetical protein VMT68_11295 [Caulobacteraceae bacterium]|nr:hypothetical protein [Caulobacteraceae bacterium]